MEDTRLRTAKYKPKSGNTIEFQYKDISRTGGKKLAITELPQQNNADIQDMGNLAQRYSLDIFFTGSDFIANADAFYNALGEKGIATLSHPRYGDLTVVPDGSWTQEENWTENVGMIKFSVTFVSASESSTFPQSILDASGSILTAIKGLNDESIASAISYFYPVSAADVAGVKAVLVTAVQGFNDGFKSIVSTTDQATVLVKSCTDFINEIDTLINDPNQLFQSICDICNIPALVEIFTGEKVDEYSNQIASTEAQVPATQAQASAKTLAMQALNASAILSSTNGEIKSRQDAIKIANSLDAIALKVAKDIETTETLVEDYVSSESVAIELARINSEAIASINERAYSLKSEQRKIIDSERTPIDLVYELYGDLTELDNFIVSNNLIGDNIILIPSGTEVLYYV